MKRRSKWALGCGLALAGLPVLLLAGLVVGLFVPNKVTDRDGPRWFRLLVCERMPASVTNLHASGTTRFTGKSVRLEFEMSNSDLPALITNGGFVPWDGIRGDAFSIARMSAGWSNPAVFRKQTASYNDQNARHVTMVVETNRGSARVDYFSP